MATAPDAVRIDKWLWVARFFKTRQLSIDAINAGRVEVNGERVKPSKSIKPGDSLLLRKPPVAYQMVVTAIAEKRGSATMAKTLFLETTESIATREKVAAELRDMPPPLFRGRPTKKDRRTLEKWQRTAGDAIDAEG
ncbi:MAG: RNA-binding S4 domain-containing protein [Burkholderiales bacterium]|nr:RNA-binding S4 domain-containing protein [Burkholderiales bacterium]